MRNFLVALLIALIWPGIATAHDVRVALVVGNSSYRHTAFLRNPSNDANLIGRVFAAAGYATEVEVDLTRDEMQRAIEAFADRLASSDPGTVAVFYFAGHGIQIDGKNYLIPVDANVDSRGSLAQSLDLEWVMDRLARAKKAANVIILDACRNNPFPTIRSSTRSVVRGLADVGRRSGTLIAFATAPGAVALDGSGGNSPYASALAEYVQRPGLSVEAMFRQVRLKVESETNFVQTPWETSSLTSEVFLSGRRASPSMVEACTARTGPYRVVGVQSNDVLNVRAEPGLEHRIVHTLAPDATGIGLEECTADNAWCHVTHKCQAGWVARRHIASTVTTGSVESFAASQPSQGLFRVVGIPGDDKLNVREDRSHKSRVKFSIASDATNVQVGECWTGRDGAKWCAITFASKDGYVNARYLRHMESDRPPF